MQFRNCGTKLHNIFDLSKFCEHFLAFFFIFFEKEKFFILFGKKAGLKTLFCLFPCISQKKAVTLQPEVAKIYKIWHITSMTNWNGR